MSFLSFIIISATFFDPANCVLLMSDPLRYDQNIVCTNRLSFLTKMEALDDIPFDATWDVKSFWNSCDSMVITAFDVRRIGQTSCSYNEIHTLQILIWKCLPL